jgi:hypothetical protein
VGVVSIASARPRVAARSRRRPDEGGEAKGVEPMAQRAVAEQRVQDVMVISRGRPAEIASS